MKILRSLALIIAMILASCNGNGCQANPGPGPGPITFPTVTSSEPVVPDAEPPAPVEINWVEYDDAIRESNKTGKPVLLYFYAPWCPFCKKLEALVWPDEEIIRIVSEKYIAVQVDVEEHPAIAGIHDVKAIPRIIVHDFRAHEELVRIPGYTPDIELYRDMLE